MKCEGCDKEFNTTKRRPHFLVHCGHSICQKCLKKKFNDFGIICPRCDMKNYASKVDDFPLNMALLEVENPAKLFSRMPSNVIRTSDQECITIESICKDHGKKYEGRHI